MPIKHLHTGQHYQVIVKTPLGVMWSAHLRLTYDDKIEVQAFIKDAEQVDQAYEVLDQVAYLLERDRRGTLREGKDKVYVWDFQEVLWQLIPRSEEAPDEPPYIPF